MLASSCQCLGSSNHLFDHAGVPSAWCSRFRKPPPWPSFVVCAPQISLKGPQFLWTQPEFLDCPRFDRYGFRQKKNLQDPGGKRKKKAQHCHWVGSKGIERGMCRPLHGSFELSLQSKLLFTLQSPDLRDRQAWGSVVDAIRLFEFRRRRNSCSMYARVLRCTGYTWRAALTKGKPQESGNPHQTIETTWWNNDHRRKILLEQKIERR